MKKKFLVNRVNRDEMRARLMEEDFERKTVSFYNYANIEDPQAFRNKLYYSLSELDVFGRIYVSYEGINGQISVPEHNFEAFREELYKIDFLNGIRLNVAVDDNGKSFSILKIKVREKIVADGLDDSTFDPTNGGKHLTAPEFNKLTDDPETIVVDMRNHYEWEVGKFKGALTPDVETFREALPVVEELLKEDKDKNIIMYCTGGIRCEKASAYFKHKGFENVHQVEGGIIEYARKAKELGIENKFIGKNFVFDDRLGERISDDVIAECHQCGKPCDTHTNCANDACHILFIQCEECAEKYSNCCSPKCQDFNALPEAERGRLKPLMEFNGTKVGKGRSKALRKSDDLEL